MNQSPFTPGPTVSITITTAGTGVNGGVALGTGAGTLAPQVVLTNAPGAGASAIVFFKFGTSIAVVAAATDTPINPNTQLCLTPPVGTTHIAAIGTDTTSKLYITVGHGVIG